MLEVEVIQVMTLKRYLTLVKQFLSVFFGFFSLRSRFRKLF